MARKPTKSEATGTVAARHAAEAERQAAAAATRAELAAETKAAHKATAKRLNDKPSDSRKLVS